MAWIRQVSDDDAEGALKSIYKAARERAGSVANIIRVMSLRPGLLNSFMSFYMRLMKSPSTLSHLERELIATVTSEVNGCFY
ncbi:MAG: peroxidase [Planctomycetota bacterium]